MLTEKDVLSFEFFKYGGVFSGSFENLAVRYRITRWGEKPDFVLKAEIWPGPEAWDVVSAKYPELLREETFFYSEEGRKAAAEWVSEEAEKLIRKDGEEVRP